MARTKPDPLVFNEQPELWPPETAQYVNRLLLMSTLADVAEAVVVEAIDIVRLVPIQDSIALGAALDVFRNEAFDEPLWPGSFCPPDAKGGLLWQGAEDAVQLFVTEHRLNADWFIVAVRRAILNWTALTWAASTNTLDIQPYLDIWRTAVYNDPPAHRNPNYPAMEPMKVHTAHAEDCERAEVEAGWAKPALLVPRDMRVLVKYRVCGQRPSDIIKSEDIDRRTVSRIVDEAEIALGLERWRQRT